MNGDLIIKDVDLEQLEEDLIMLEGVFEDFVSGSSAYLFTTEAAGKRVLEILQTWAEGRKAEKEDEELAESLTTDIMLTHVKKPIRIKTAILCALKEQRKRLGK